MSARAARSVELAMIECDGESNVGAVVRARLGDKKLRLDIARKATLGASLELLASEHRDAVVIRHEADMMVSWRLPPCGM